MQNISVFTLLPDAFISCNLFCSSLFIYLSKYNIAHTPYMFKQQKSYFKYPKLSIIIFFNDFHITICCVCIYVFTNTQTYMLFISYNSLDMKIYICPCTVHSFGCHCKLKSSPKHLSEVVELCRAHALVEMKGFLKP
ncbi:hypothetical protein FKM82_006980 [Ascaphus truei]